MSILIVASSATPLSFPGLLQASHQSLADFMPQLSRSSIEYGKSVTIQFQCINSQSEFDD